MKDEAKRLNVTLITPTYMRFKYHCLFKGLRITKALDQAVEDWMDANGVMTIGEVQALMERAEAAKKP